jgi:hypothetical protein
LLPSYSLVGVRTFHAPFVNDFWGHLRSLSDHMHHAADTAPVKGTVFCIGTICGGPTYTYRTMITGGLYYPDWGGPIKGINALDLLHLISENYNARSRTLRNAINLTITVKVPKDSPLATALQ